MTDTAVDVRTDDDGSAVADEGDDPGAAGGTETQGDDVRRRWLLRLLLGLGIGVPVAIEARTFLGLFRAYLFGDSGGATATPTATPAGSAGVGVGDELLTGTEPTETVRESQIRVLETGWRFDLSVEVTNTAESPYELRLGDVRTGGGETVDGGASTGRISPDDTTTVEGTWPLPSESRPETVTVTALVYTGEDVDLTEQEVRLARPSLRG